MSVVFVSDVFVSVCALCNRSYSRVLSPDQIGSKWCDGDGVMFVIVSVVLVVFVSGVVSVRRQVLCQPVVCVCVAIVSSL